MGCVLVVVVALWALPDVAHDGFGGSAPGKLAFFLSQGLNLIEWGYLAVQASISKMLDQLVS